MSLVKFLLRTPAHSGQKVTTLQVYPENGCLLSAGVFQCKFITSLCCVSDDITTLYPIPEVRT